MISAESLGSASSLHLSAVRLRGRSLLSIHIGAYHENRRTLPLRLCEIRGRSGSRNDDHLQLHRLPNHERRSTASSHHHSSRHVCASIRHTNGISKDRR